MTAAELRALFLRERAAFERRFPRAGGCGLAIVPEPCPVPPCASRDFGAYYPGAHLIVFSRRVLDRPRASIVALLRHELGHAADPTPSRAGAEARADRLARQAGGRSIRYGRDLVQTLDERAEFGRRPAWLPR